MDMCTIVLVVILVLIVNKASLYEAIQFMFYYQLPSIIVVTVYILPKITQQPTNTSGNLYSIINLTCRATGDPIPTILWYKDNLLIPNDNNDPSVLTFFELNLKDRGFYHCQARSLIRGKFISVNSSQVILNITGINKDV